MPGPPITDVVRTALDCLATMSFGAALDLYAWLTTREHLDRGRLTAAIVAGTGRRGVGQLRRLQRQTAGGALSEAERRMHTLLNSAGLDGWRSGAWISDVHGVIGVVDIVFDAERVVIEIEGLRAHSDPVTVRRDRRRQNRLVMAGYLVLRFTWDDLTVRPEDVIRQVRLALRGRISGASAV